MEGEDSYTILSNGVKIHYNMYYFIGGLLKYVEELFLIWAPFLNSYKRYKLNSFAPYYINTWSYDNKTSAVRLIGEGDSLRLEFRLPGADVNPYLLLTAVIASGMKGIEDKIIPPPIVEGNTYEKDPENYITAPKNIYEATRIFEKSLFAEEVFRRKLKEILINTSINEWNLYIDKISSFELNRYLDLA